MRLPDTDHSKAIVDICCYRWWPVRLIAWNAANVLFHRRIVEVLITPAILVPYKNRDGSIYEPPPRGVRPSEYSLIHLIALVGGCCAELPVAPMTFGGWKDSMTRAGIAVGTLLIMAFSLF